MVVLTLVKYQGLGNDFLVALDGRGLDAAAGERARLAPAGPCDADRDADHLAGLARVLCDRHTGVGADGLLVLRAAVSGGDVRMELRNADGGRAETSGNGLRCFALAAVEAGLVAGPELAIETDSGLRRAVLRRRDGLGSADVSVEMGCIRVRPLDPVARRVSPGFGRATVARLVRGRRQPPRRRARPLARGRRDLGGRPDAREHEARWAERGDRHLRTRER